MKPAPRIVLLCATRRGVAFVRRIFTLCPEAGFVVCSFPEEPWEPPFLAELEGVVKAAGQRMIVTRQVATADLFQAGECDLLLAVNWRYLVPREVYARFRRGAFVFHDSLLPRYRGFSPTSWAMINGEPETGVTLFEMVESVDSGRIVDQAAVPIGPEEFIGSVVDRVTAAYLLLLERNLARLLAGTAELRAQNDAEATYTCKRVPDDNRISWPAPAARVFDLIRACSSPYPGAYCFWEGKRLTIWTCDLPDRTRPHVGVVPGRIIERVPGQGVRVLANDFPLLLRKVQLEGGPVVTADELLKSLAQTLT